MQGCQYDGDVTRTSAMTDIWVPLRAGTVITFLGAIIFSHAHELEPTRRGISRRLIQSVAILSGPLPILLRFASIFATHATKTRLHRMPAWSGLIGSLCLQFGRVTVGTISSRD